MKKYKTSRHDPRIDVVFIAKETPSFIFFDDGSKRKKDGYPFQYFDTFEEARAALITNINEIMIPSNERLMRHAASLNKVIHLKEEDA